MINAPPRSKSNTFHTSGDGHNKSPGYVLHELEVDRFVLLLVVLSEGKSKSVMLLRDRAVRLAMTVSVSCSVSEGNSCVLADELVVLASAAGARVDEFAAVGGC